MVPVYLDISEESEFKDIIIARAKNASVDDDQYFIIKLSIELEDNKYISNLHWGSENEIWNPI